MKSPLDSSQRATWGVVRLNHAVLRWVGRLLSDVPSARTPLLPCLRIDFSSLRKSARRPRLFSLNALAASATMSCQDRSGLALVSDMAGEKGREDYALPSVSTFSTEGSALRLPVAGFSVMPLTAIESVKKRQTVFRSRGTANPHHSAPSRAEQNMAHLLHLN